MESYWRITDKNITLLLLILVALICLMGAQTASWLGVIEMILCLVCMVYITAKLDALKENIHLIYVINLVENCDNVSQSKIVERCLKMIRSSKRWDSANDFREDTFEYELLNSKNSVYKGPIWDFAKKIKALHDREKGIPDNYPLYATVNELFERMMDEMRAQTQSRTVVPKDDGSEWMRDLDDIFATKKPSETAEQEGYIMTEIIIPYIFGILCVIVCGIIFLCSYYRTKRYIRIRTEEEKQYAQQMMEEIRKEIYN